MKLIIDMIINIVILCVKQIDVINIGSIISHLLKKDLLKLSKYEKRLTLGQHIIHRLYSK